MSPRLRVVAALVVAASNLLLTVDVRAEVIITEIMYNPQGNDQETGINREWAELYNTGTMSVDISGWQFGDSSDGQWAVAFPEGTIIGANHALVVTGDNTSFDAEWALI